jgi:hypothetical protein
MKRVRSKCEDVKTATDILTERHRIGSNDDIIKKFYECPHSL